MTRRRPPRPPRTAVEPCREPKVALNPARQDDGLKRVKQHAEDKSKPGNSGYYIHSESDEIVSGMVAELPKGTEFTFEVNEAGAAKLVFLTGTCAL